MGGPELARVHKVCPSRSVYGLRCRMSCASQRDMPRASMTSMLDDGSRTWSRPTHHHSIKTLEMLLVVLSLGSTAQFYPPNLHSSLLLRPP